MLKRIIVVFASLTFATNAYAATLNVVDGQLIGASGVLVDGSFYDVQFLDGTCVDLYNGCDDVSDFTFQTQGSARLASQALLDQVFLDGLSGAFDSVPSLTNGCDVVPNQPGLCVSFTPFAPVPAGFSPFPLPIALSYNYPPGGTEDRTTPRSVCPDAHGCGTFLHYGLATHAVWQAAPIPEPTTALLLGLGLASLAVRRETR